MGCRFALCHGHCPKGHIANSGYNLPVCASRLRYMKPPRVLRYSELILLNTDYMLIREKSGAPPLVAVG